MDDPEMTPVKGYVLESMLKPVEFRELSVRFPEVEVPLTVQVMSDADEPFCSDTHDAARLV
jgi:hypothetical protein